MYFPNLDELSFLIVLAFPNAKGKNQEKLLLFYCYNIKNIYLKDEFNIKCSA